LPDAARSEGPRKASRQLRQTWRRLGPEQRAAGVGAVLLIVSTFGPFSFVEAALLLVAGGVLLLLRQRAEGREFHLPFGDGTVILAAGCWAAFLIVVRLFDRPLGQGLLALACAAILILAGIRERARRPADDLPEPLRAADAAASPSFVGRRPLEDLPARRPEDRPHATGAPEELPRGPKAGEGERDGPGEPGA
jgi:hypothetical protein